VLRRWVPHMAEEQGGMPRKAADRDRGVEDQEAELEAGLKVGMEVGHPGPGTTAGGHIGVGVEARQESEGQKLERKVAVDMDRLDEVEDSSLRIG
jgi:hypothetical protein